MKQLTKKQQRLIKVLVDNPGVRLGKIRQEFYQNLENSDKIYQEKKRKEKKI